MDIGSKNGYPSSALSNFAPHPFVFDGVECNSMEGLLQSFKFDKAHIQVEVCKLVGFAAKKRGSDRTKAWQRVQTLWWKEVEFPRDSKEYQQLLDMAYISMAKDSDSFRRALLATNDAVLTHTMGRNKEADTVLTQREFCRRLMSLRNLLVHQIDLTKVTEL